MNNEEFMRLPLLLKPGEAQAALNVNRDALRAMSAKGLVVVLPGQKMRRYRKSVVAQLAGFKIV